MWAPLGRNHVGSRLFAFLQIKKNRMGSFPFWLATLFAETEFVEDFDVLITIVLGKVVEQTTTFAD